MEWFYLHTSYLITTEGKNPKTLFQLQILGTDSFNTDFAPLNQNKANLACVIKLELTDDKEIINFLDDFPVYSISWTKNVLTPIASYRGL